jgi:YggT family protein
LKFMEFVRHLVTIVLNLLSLAIFIRVLLSWIRLDPNNLLVKFVIEVTEPILNPIRQIVPQIGVFDISPVVAILAIEFIQQLINALIK